MYNTYTYSKVLRSRIMIAEVGDINSTGEKIPLNYVFPSKNLNYFSNYLKIY